MQSDSNNPSVLSGFPKFGRMSQSHAAQPAGITKQRSLLSQSLLSAELDKDRRRCKQEQVFSSAEHSDSEETSLDLDEELEEPTGSCCSGAMQISRR